jgi:hypothetical protein
MAQSACEAYREAHDLTLTCGKSANTTCPAAEIARSADGVTVFAVWVWGGQLAGRARRMSSGTNPVVLCPEPTNDKDNVPWF